MEIVVAIHAPKTRAIFLRASCDGALLNRRFFSKAFLFSGPAQFANSAICFVAVNAE